MNEGTGWWREWICTIDNCKNSFRLGGRNHCFQCRRAACVDHILKYKVSNGVHKVCINCNPQYLANTGSEKLVETDPWKEGMVAYENW